MNQQAMMIRQQMIRNPQQFAQNALRSGYFNNSPMHKNALEAVASGNVDEIKNITQNVCKEHNVSMDDAMAQYKQQYGIQ